MVRRVRQEGRAMNRRDIFKGAGGAVAAVTLARDAQMARATIPGLSHIPPPQPIDPASLLPDLDPMLAAKHALMAKANDEAQSMQTALQRRRASLMRMRSVSQAYVEYQMYQADKEQTAIWQRVEEARKFIFG